MKGEKEAEMGNTDNDVSDDVIEYSDVTHRQTPTCERVIATAAMFFAFFSLGLGNSVLGATLLPLAAMTRSSTDHVALLFTWGFLGRLVGALSAGFVLHLISPTLLLGAAILGCAVCVGAVPFCHLYLLLGGVTVVQGFFTGFLSTGCNTHIFRLWGAKAPPVYQGLLFVISLGSAVTPSLVDVLLRQAAYRGASLGICDVTLHGNKSTCMAELIGEIATHSGSAEVEQGLVLELEQTIAAHNYSDIQQVALLPHNLSANNSILDNTFPHSSENALIIPYLVIAISHTPSLLCFIAVFIKQQCRVLVRYHSQGGSNSSSSTHSRFVATWHTPLAAFLIIMSALYMLCCGGLEVTIGGLVIMFAIQYLGWTTTASSHLATVYWLCLATGRGLGVPVARYFSSKLIVGAGASVTMATAVVMALGCDVSPLVSWICAAAFGLSLATLIANGFVLTRKYVAVEGGITSILTVGMFGGGLVTPALTGYLFENVNQMWFTYSLVVQSGLLLVLYAGIMFTGHMLERRQSKYNRPDSQDTATEPEAEVMIEE